MHDVTDGALPEANENTNLVGRREPGILIVDEMALAMTLLKFALEPRGFTVWLAVDGDDALDLYRQNRAAIDVVLIDVQMAGIDGPQTLAALQRIEPEVLACFMMGSSSRYTRGELLARGAACLFHKPFRADDVAHCVQRLVQSAIGSLEGLTAGLHRLPGRIRK